MMTPLAVWPLRELQGWDGTGPPPAGIVIAKDGAAALTASYESDAHCVGYVVPGETNQPRLNMACLDALPIEPLMRWAFIDVDNEGHAPWPDAFTAEIVLETVLDQLPGAGGYTTKHGYRIVWELPEPVKVTYWGSFWDQLTHWVEKVADVKADEACRDWTRCYRMPNVDRAGDGTVQLAHATRAPGLLQWTPTGTLIKDAPSKAAVRSHDPLPDDMAATPSDLPLIKALPLAQESRVLDGRPLAAKGHRDSAMVGAIGALLNAMKEPAALPVFRILRRSVAAMGDEPGVAKLWDRCQHFAALKAADRIEANDLRERIAGAAKDLPLVLVGDGSRRYYVLAPEARSYRGPFAADMLPRVMIDALSDKYPGMQIVHEKTGSPLPTNQLLIESAAIQLNEVIWKMGSSTTEYNHETRTLTRPCCEVRAPAVRHPVIIEWLETLAGEQAETLLDWCATMAQVDSPTCALYLDGVNGVGKSMFAAAMAQVFGASWTTYKQVTSDYNAALLRCPVVVADEGLPSNTKQVSSDLRSLVSERSRPLTQKYIGDATIIGCPRLIISANGPDALRLINETLTSEDIEAIAKRILYIKCGEKRPGDTTNWVTMPDGAPGKIAQTVSWLAKNRSVKPGKRFLVEGARVDWHENLTRATGASGDVLAVLAYHLEKGRYNPLLITGEGDCLLVYPRAVRDLWPQMLPGERTPGDRMVSRTIATLSTGKVKRRVAGGGQRWFYRVPLSQIIAEANARLIGTPEDLTAEANRPHKDGAP